ncbi:MAG: hypothetical protein QOE28_320, partial [Solirubrobacteraceae bacterium]|nr:hypothetical protein [Solirubrobacteraceae bacterium]
MEPLARLIVRNPFTHDARVLRAAGVLRDLGYRPAVLAVMSTAMRERHGSVDGVPVLRLDPGSPLAWARRRAGRAAATGAAPAAGAHRRPGPLVRLHRYLRTLDFYRRAIGVVLRERPALVHCNDYNTMWIGVAARLLTGAAVLYDAHELWPDRNGRPEPRWWLLAWEALFVRLAGAVVTASPGFAEEMRRRYRIPLPAVVLNVPDAPPAPRRMEPPRLDTVVYAGAITAHRGIEEAISALALLPGVRLQLLGPGQPPYLGAVRAHAERLGVAERVEVLPTVAPGAVVGAIAGAGAGLALFQPVCLSHRLVAPNKLFEYMAAGLPSLASDLPVIRSYLERFGCGAVARPDDPSDIARRLAWLLEPEHNRRCRDAAERAARVMSWASERHVLADA